MSDHCTTSGPVDRLGWSFPPCPTCGAIEGAVYQLHIDGQPSGEKWCQVCDTKGRLWAAQQAVAAEKAPPVYPPRYSDHLSRVYGDYGPLPTMEEHIADLESTLHAYRIVLDDLSAAIEAKLPPADKERLAALRKSGGAVQTLDADTPTVVEAP